MKVIHMVTSYEWRKSHLMLCITVLALGILLECQNNHCYTQPQVVSGQEQLETSMVKNYIYNP